MSKFRIFFLFSISALIVSFSFTQKVSASTFITSDISENTTWDASGSPYIIENPIAVLADVTLTVSPGVVVKFGYGVEFAIFGTLNISGEDGNEAIFTSIADDILEDSNGDSDNSVPYEGDWFGVSLYDGSNLNISEAILRFSSFGVYADLGSSSTLSNTSIANTFIPIERHVGSTFYLENGMLFSNNIQNAHFIFGGTDGLSGNVNFGNGIPYVLLETFVETPTFNATFSPGAILKLYDPVTNISLTNITISGTSLSPVIFTSYYDDSAGGDSDGGIDPDFIYYTWGDLDFFGNVSISNLIVRYEYFGVSFTDVDGIISDSSITESLSCADFFGDSNITISNVECIDTSVGGITLFDNSSLDINHLELSDSGSGIELFGISSITGSQLIVENDVSISPALELYNGSTANISNLIALGTDSMPSMFLIVLHSHFQILLYEIIIRWGILILQDQFLSTRQTCGILIKLSM